MDSIRDAISSSNVIACADDLGSYGLDYLFNSSKNHALNHPWVILPNGSPPTRPSLIGQQLYYYDANTTFIRETYAINGVVVERCIFKLPMECW